jgi:hypothetical protein
MTRRGSVGLAVVLAAAVSACSQPGGLETVRAYNEAVSLAYRTGDTSGLSDVAMPREVERVARRIALKKRDGLVLESSLEEIRELSTQRVSAGGLVVESQERWRYYDRPLLPGKSAGPTVVALTTLRYELQRAGDGWRVIKVRTLTNEYLQPAGYAPPNVPHGRTAEVDPDAARKVFSGPAGASPVDLPHGHVLPPNDSSGGEAQTP